MAKIGTINGPCEWLEGEPSDYEKKTEVRTYRVTMACPKCGTGEMIFNGMSWPMAPPGLHHTCTECGYICAIIGHQYPETRTEPK